MSLFTSEPDEPVEIDLYTEEVKKHIYETKARLPIDFTLNTIDNRGPFLVISINSREFDWRTVEDRLAIAIQLERLKTLIEKEGIRCVIEKG